MLRFSSLLLVIPLCLGLAALAMAADGTRQVVVYEGVVTEVAKPAEASKDLWLTMKELTRATGFVLKPQGMCKDTLCFPIPKNRKSEFVAKRGKTQLFNLSEFARLVRQPFALDEKHGVWYFGARQDEQSGYIETLDAPDFKLPDMNGKLHSLSDFRGKKVLLITWASW
jgi:hypothetical protein